MSISARALLTAIHGMLFGGFFLMAIFATAVELFRRRFESQPALLTAAGRSWERIYLIATAAAGWAAVLLGAYVVYPWYRALPPPGLADLAAFPQALLKSSPATAGWHNLGMEWKE